MWQAGVFIDLQKAFDMVNHDILCEKLAHYVFRGNRQLLIRSFLSNRQQYVYINGFDSSKLDIRCGVPQGSTLGPLLFLLYINDLGFALKCNQSSATRGLREICQHLGFHLLTLTNLVYQTSSREGIWEGGRKPLVAEDWSKNCNYNSYLVSSSYNSSILIPSLLLYRRFTRLQSPCMMYKEKRYIPIYTVCTIYYMCKKVIQ